MLINHEDREGNFCGGWPYTSGLIDNDQDICIYVVTGMATLVHHEFLVLIL